MKKIILTFTALFIFYLAKTQQFPQYNQFLFNKASVFTAYSGFNQNSEAFITLQQRLLGFPGAPKLADFYIGTALSPKMGTSFDFLTQSTGNFNKTILRFTYAYFIQLSDQFFINVGLTPTAFLIHYNIANAQNFGNSIDPMLNNTLAKQGYTGDLGFSLAVHAKNFDFALSAPQILGLKAKINGQNYSLSRLLSAYASYNLNLNENLDIEPFIYSTADQNLTFDLLAGFQLKYRKILFSHLSFDYNGQLNLGFGGIVRNNILISYQYGFGLYGLPQSSAGSHCLNIGFLIKQNDKFRQPTIFPEKNEQIDLQKITEKLNNIETQLRREKTTRQHHDQMLQQQIDSLKKQQIPATQQQPEPQPEPENKQTQTVWVQKITSPTINFGLNSSRLLPSSYAELDKYAQLLKQDPTLKIKIAVHTDNLGSPEFKLKLSEARARAIANYLISKGVNPEQIIWVGKGAAEPIASNSTLEGRRKNNRVEIQFNKKVLK